MQTHATTETYATPNRRVVRAAYDFRNLDAEPPGKLPYQFGGRQLFDFVKLRYNYVFVSRALAWILTPLANMVKSAWEYFGLPIDEIECWAVRHVDE